MSQLGMGKPLAGRTVAIPETRELNRLAEMLEEQGAATIRCPLVGIIDAPDPEPINEWLRELVAGRFDDLVLLTGEGLRRLLGFARRTETYDAVVAALTTLFYTVDEWWPDLPAEEPTTEGVIAALSKENLAGRAVGVQLYAQVPNPKLVEFLERAGATVRTVAPYVYAPASDEDEVLDLIHRLECGQVDVIAFTSASQVERLWAVARNRGAEIALSSGMARTRVAAVGPVVAEELRQHGAEVHISPMTAFFMRPMVNKIVEVLTGPT